MTPEEHRTLDADVAEKVMGWGFPEPDSTPSYSTDIAAAWTIVEKLRGEYVRVELAYARFFGPDTGYQQGVFKWECHIHCAEPENWRNYHPGYGQTPAEAICHAALMTVEETP